MKVTEFIDEIEFENRLEKYIEESLKKNYRVLDFLKFEINYSEDDSDKILHLALRSLYGVNRKKSYKDAYELFYEDYKQGNLYSTYYLGICYYLGFGVKKSHDKALYYWKECLDKNHLESISIVAFCYDNGIHIEKDIEIANKLYSYLEENSYKSGLKRFKVKKGLFKFISSVFKFMFNFLKNRLFGLLFVIGIIIFLYFLSLIVGEDVVIYNFEIVGDKILEMGHLKFMALFLTFVLICYIVWNNIKKFYRKNT